MDGHDFAQAVDGFLAKGGDINTVLPNGHTFLTLAVATNNPDAVKMLIQRGADVEKLNGAGESPLTRAAHAGHTEMARILLDRGARVDAQNNLGTTALTIAAAGGNEGMTNLLIERGADPTMANMHGATALSHANPAVREQVQVAAQSGFLQRMEATQMASRASAPVIDFAEASDSGPAESAPVAARQAPRRPSGPGGP
jgi:uncharacterized protein